MNTSVLANSFEVKEILYEANTFIVAWGKYKDGIERMGMRFDATIKDPAGFPNSNGKGTWLIIDEPLEIPFLTALIGNTAHNSKVLNLLNQLV